MAYSFQKVFFFGQNSRSHDIFFSWTFELLLVNYSRYLVLGVLKEIFLIIPKKYCLWMQTSWERNQSWNKNKHFNLFLWYGCWKTCFSMKSSNSLWIIFYFSPFHEHIFRSSCSQIFFEIIALKNFTIFWIKKRLNTCVSLSVLWILRIF